MSIDENDDQKGQMQGSNNIPPSPHPSQSQSVISPIAQPPYTIFDIKQKWMIVCIVSFAATFSGSASNIYFPALPTIASDLNVSFELVDLTVTSYLIFQGIAPSIWGPISDVRGRRLAYICTFIVFLGACIGLAQTQNYATLLVLRCLQSTGSASTVAIGSGVMGDITTRAERGGFMGIFQAGFLVPLAIGPVIGGALAGSLGWRSIFWFLTIYSGILLVLLIILFPETLRSLVANGGLTPSDPISRYPLNIYQRLTTIKIDEEHKQQLPAKRKPIDILGPFRILISKYTFPIIIFFAINYTAWQMCVTAMSSLFKSRYGLDETQIGLTFIPNGVGSMVGTVISGKILDSDYRRVKAKHEQSSRNNPASLEDGIKTNSYTEINDDNDNNSEFPIEKARLRLVPMFSCLQCLSLLLFGWTIHYSESIHIAIPIISTFITGWSVISTQSIIMTYFVDIFPHKSAAASASINLAKCFFAAGGTSFIMPMIDGIGIGLSFTICVCVQFVALIGPLVQCKFAATWRREAEKLNT